MYDIVIVFLKVINLIYVDIDIFFIIYVSNLNKKIRIDYKKVNV